MVVFIISNLSFANSAEPPSILIIVPNAPDDLQISIKSDGQYINANITNKIIETYYTFYSNDLNNIVEYTIKVNTGNTSFETPLEEPFRTYNNVFVLDLKNQSLTKGKSLSRTIILVSLRILLTLIIEAIVFVLFLYKHKRSWVIFLIVNLLTQGGLNLWLNGFPPLQSYLIFSLIFGEIWVFIIEIIAFSKLIKEHSLLRTISYVIIANALSLVLWGYIISVLPI